MSKSISRCLAAARRLCAAAFLLGTVSMAQAAVVTIDEAGLDQIFAQAGIDVRVGAATTIYNSALLNMDIDEFYDTVTPSFRGVIPVYFIDSFVPDDVYIGGNTIGLGWVGAGGVAVVSNWAADLHYSATLIGHELGHNLGLDHVNNPLNLMNYYIVRDSVDFLTGGQVDSIRRSPLVSIDAFGQRYISIAPIAIMATLAPVPEPSTYAMLLAGLGLIGYMRRRKA